MEEAIRAMAKQRAEDTHIARLTAHMAKTEAYFEKTSPEHDRTRKWAEDNAKRLDALEGQVREQTNEATHYTEATCKEMDGKLRIELDTNIPKLMGDLDDRVAGRIKDLEDKLKA